MRSAAFERLAAGDHAGALPYATAARDLFPDKAEAAFWLACIHSRLGRPQAAVADLRRGLERGHYWPQSWLLEDDDLEPLRGRADFGEVVGASARAEAAALPSGPLEPVVLPAAPVPAGPRAPRATVVALHGWGQDAPEFALHWRAAAAAGFTVVVARSSQEPCPGFFVWDDRERALQDVARQLAVPGAGPPGPLVAAGFSQGGGVAVDLALAGLCAPVATSMAVLALAAGLGDLAAPPAAGRLDAAAARGLRVRLLVGAQDEDADDAQRLARVLSRAGLGARLTLVPGLAHEVPEPPGELLARELAALVD